MFTIVYRKSSQICDFSQFTAKIGNMTDKTRKQDLIEEVIEAEKSFCKMALERGIGEAFLSFADEEAVISRDNHLFRGKGEIEQYYRGQSLNKVRLDWHPDFVDVAQSGDMAWTYGEYTLSSFSEGILKVEAKGIFHTVWKRQADGSWRYVWD